MTGDLPDGPDFSTSEAIVSQLAAVALLTRIEEDEAQWRYLTHREVLAARGGSSARNLLADVLRTQLERLNVIRWRGEERPFSQSNIARAIAALEDVPLIQGVLRASESVYDLLRLGKSFDETIAGDTRGFTVRYVDWENPSNNVYHVATEVPLRRTEILGIEPSTSARIDGRADVVLYVNGIPFVHIECKAPSVPLDEAIRDVIAYHRPDYAPDFAKYLGLTIACNRTTARYAVVGTPPKFWAAWKSRDSIDDPLRNLLASPLPPSETLRLAGDFVREQQAVYDAEGDPSGAAREPSEQDRLLYELCRPSRLLKLVREYTLFDSGDRKIARYQQFYAVEEAIRLIETGMSEGKRRGATIWHTQGSGKSLTMVLLANAIAQSPHLHSPRIVLVTDRKDLDRQIAGTFRRCGLDVHRATSGADLRREIRAPRADVLTTLVNKFAAATRSEGVIDASPDVFVLVDEGHRTQYGELAVQMARVFPNAWYLGFTGTPLTTDQTRNTLRRFGPILDSYTMREAVEDGAVVPLLYERRHVDQNVQQSAIDTWFDRQSAGLTEDQRRDLKRKYSAPGRLLKTEERLRTIAWDVALHFRQHWKGTGYKAQLVAPNKRSALVLRNCIEEATAGLPLEEQVACAVVISLTDEREGLDPGQELIDDADVDAFTREMLARYGSEDRYNEALIGAFDSAEGPDLLICVDKLLTGFDAPRNTVLYLARPLKSHTLLQAIARVNRLFEGKEFGYIIDYVGVLGELDRALTEYSALAGFVEDDLEGSLMNLRDEIARLPERYARLLELFREIERSTDGEAYERLLADPDLRAEFRVRFNVWAKTLRIALASESFYSEASPATITRYKADLIRFARLKRAVEIRYGDSVDMARIEPQIAKLLDRYVSSEGVEILTPTPIDIMDPAAMEEALDALGTPAAKADAMANATSRTITERMDEDPARFRRFSEMLQKTIQGFRDHLFGELEYLRRIRQIRDAVASGSSPSEFPGLEGCEHAQIYARALADRWGDLRGSTANESTLPDLALALDRAITRHASVVDWRFKDDVMKAIRAEVDDVFFAYSADNRIRRDWSALDEIASELIQIARSRLP